MLGKIPLASDPRGPRAQGPNIYYYKIRVSFVKEILSFRCTFRHEIEKSSSNIRELADLLIIMNHFMSSSFPEVCTAFLLLVTFLVNTENFERSFSKIKLLFQSNTLFKLKVIRKLSKNATIIIIAFVPLYVMIY